MEPAYALLVHRKFTVTSCGVHRKIAEAALLASELFELRPGKPNIISECAATSTEIGAVKTGSERMNDDAFTTHLLLFFTHGEGFFGAGHIERYK